ncbi:hypothetical protein [Undibacterium terreum]|uniref:Uncharacterized protein n=1 Tax=Undibacterium terreum TaxID=1224302 RepID=A0A916V0P4_9BURK|nr:hypothetical protein [Undibacterium terreum]GGD01525.1 hypothetical protein GCM10011396_56320 [Undibacterium terreum]
MKKLLIALCLLPMLAFAKTEMLTDNAGNPILEQFGEEGFVDCVFRISNLTEAGDSYRFHMSAAHQGDVLGLDVVVAKGIKGAFDASLNLIKEHVVAQGVRFIRSGPESDRLISVLSGLYGNPPKKLKMVSQESYTAIALHQGSIDISAEPVKIKIFGKDGDTEKADAYYETFFNLDLKKRLVFWNEKDQGYRKPLMQALTAAN